MPFNLTGQQLKEFFSEYKEKMTPVRLISDTSMEELRQYRKQMVEAIQSGKTPKEAMGLTDDILESMYAHALEHYYSGNKRKALIYLRSLTLMDPTNPKYSLALGMVLQLTKSYEQATFSYLLSTCQDASNPIPWFHMGSCYHELGIEEKAISSLETAIELGDNQLEYEKLIAQSKLLLNKYKDEGEKPN